MFKYKKFDILKRESPLVVFVGGSRQFSLEQPEPEIEREWQKTSTSLALRNQRPHPAWTNSLSSNWCVPSSCNLPSLFLHKLNEMVLWIINQWYCSKKTNIFFSFQVTLLFLRKTESNDLSMKYNKWRQYVSWPPLVDNLRTQTWTRNIVGWTTISKKISSQ